MLTVFRTRFHKMFPLAAVLTCLLPTVVAAEDITIVGTGDGITILRSLGAAFNEIHPEITVTVPPSIGSSGGIKAVGSDQYPLGRIAREIKEKEKPYGLSYLPFAKQPVVFFVNHSVQIKDLSRENILAIFSGQIKNWKELGAAEGKIRVVWREDGDSSRRALGKTLPGFVDIVPATKSKVTTTTQETFALVADTRGTIGFGPYSEAVQAGLNILSVDGKTPTDPAYPSSTVLALIFKEENKTEAIGVFLEFATSAEAATVIRRVNAVPY